MSVLRDFYRLWAKTDEAGVTWLVFTPLKARSGAGDGDL